MTPQHPAAPETETDANGLTEAEVQRWAYNDPEADSPVLFAQSSVERIIAERVRVVEGERDAARAEGEISGQMKHITAEIVRGDQPLEAKEEMIADLRARLSHVQAERDSLLAEIQKGQQLGGHEPSDDALDLAQLVLEGRVDVDAARAALTAQHSRVIHPEARAESAEAAHEAEKAAHERLVKRMSTLADEFDAKGRRGSAHFGADVGDTIRLWIDRDPRNLGGGEAR